MSTFEEANAVVHPVEGEWHYPIMTKYGYRPLTDSQVGFVRRYRYVAQDGSMLDVSTGVFKDYWSDHSAVHPGEGLWMDLESHLKGTKFEGR